jgi:hypothetical protein
MRRNKMYEFQMFFQETAITIGIATIGLGAFAICYYVWMFFYKTYGKETARKQLEGYIERGGKTFCEYSGEIDVTHQTPSEWLDELIGTIKK